MAFRPPQEQDQQGVPSLGYRLSSNRQPGIEQSNNMMPQQRMEPRPFPNPEQFRKGKPAPMPMPDPREYRNMPDPRFEFRDRVPDPRLEPRFDPRFDMPDRSYPDFKRDFNYDNYLNRGLDDMNREDAIPAAYVPGDDYGSYIGDSVLGMDELGGQYDPMDEYEFDKDLFDFRIRTPGLDDLMPNYNSGGIVSLRR